jgi:AcrR family transcriptional regulator
METELSPRERRRRRTEQAILDAARRIISEDGPDGLSMRAIAERIDYSAAGLYEYFGGKDEIIHAVCGQGHARLTATMQRVDPGLPATEYLVEIGQAYIDFAVRNPDYFVLMFTDPESGPPPGMRREDVLQQMTDEGSSFGLLLRAIQRGIDDGIFIVQPGYDTLEMAHTAWSIVHGMAMLRIGNARSLPMDFASAEREGLRRLVLALQRL